MSRAALLPTLRRVLAACGTSRTAARVLIALAQTYRTPTRKVLS